MLSLRSMIVDPMGRVQTELDETEGIAYGEVGECTRIMFQFGETSADMPSRHRPRQHDSEEHSDFCSAEIRYL